MILKGVTPAIKTWSDLTLLLNYMEGRLEQYENDFDVYFYDYFNWMRQQC